VNGDGLVARTVILGIGNVLLSDDAAGIRAAEHLGRRLAGRNDVQIIDGGTLSFTLLEYLENAEALIVIDAAQVGAAPGAVQSFESEAMDAFLTDTARQRSVHEVGLLDLLSIARLREELPEKRALVCIQAALIGWGLELTPAVGAALPAAADEAERLLDRWWA
jgi:hydrogenase maturation protease